MLFALQLGAALDTAQSALNPISNEQGGKLGTSPLAEAFAATGTIKGPACGIARLLLQLDADDRALVESWLAADKNTIAHAHISRALTKVGHRVDASSVGRHRRGECLCST